MRRPNTIVVAVIRPGDRSKREYRARPDAGQSPIEEIAMHYLLGRLREPSTYAGVAIFLAAVIGLDLQATVWWQYVVEIGIGVGGLIAALTPDRSSRIADEIEAEKVAPNHWKA